MTDRSDGPRNDSSDTRAADSSRGVNFDEQNGTSIGAIRGARLDRERSTPIGAGRDAKLDRQEDTPLDADAPRSRRRGASRSRHQERRGPLNTRRQRSGHAPDETADAWMYRPGEDAPPRSGYGEQGFGAGEVEDGRWGGGSRGGYGGGLPGGDRKTRGGWSAARQYHEMGRGPRSFGPDGWGPSDPTPGRKDAGPSPERKGARPAPEQVPAPERHDE
jgi:hypothetical protein